MSTPTTSFRLAPMSPLIWVLTVFLLALPAVFLGMSAVRGGWLTLPALLLLCIYAWVWLWFRPTLFVVRPGILEVIWPLRRRQLRREEISEVKHLDRDELRRRTGWGMRVGAGGLWGGFGWLWTEKRGVVQMYVSRTDDFVWIERGGERPWLITPEHPATFVRVLSGR
jgi:hypothetical protein